LFSIATSGGAEPVLEWLRGLPPEDRRVIGADLATVQFGWPIGMPLCRALGNGSWEVRSKLPRQRIARLLFFAGDGRLGVVHGFIKKKQGFLEFAWAYPLCLRREFSLSRFVRRHVRRRPRHLRVRR
jgi:phage-related protein